MTNAERIRAMSDEEMAEFITETIENGHEWFDRRQCDLCKKENNGQCINPGDEPCERAGYAVLDWLKDAAKSE